MAVSTNAYSLITRALRLIGELASEEVPTSAQTKDGLEHLNDLMDALRTQKLMCPSMLRTVTPLVAGKTEYTIGSTQGSPGEINIIRPVKLEWAGLIQDTTAAIPMEVPLEILTDERWARTPQKSQPGMALSIYFEDSWGNGSGRIFPFPVPNTSTTALVIYTMGQWPEFNNGLQFTYVLPPGWTYFLRLRLAKSLASEYGRTFVNEDELAVAYADVKRVSQHPRELRNSYPDCERSGLYNILTDN